MGTKYKVEQLCGGPRWDRLTPQSFARSSAAYAWLIDYLNARDFKVIIAESDVENPGCYDVMAGRGTYCEQFAINIDR